MRFLSFFSDFSEVAKDETTEVTCKMTPKTSGEKNIVAKFWSRELDDVDGYKVINVKPKPEPENLKPEQPDIVKPAENELTN